MSAQLWALWPAALCGVYLQAMRVIYALPTLVSDDGTVFIKRAVVDGILRFHEADPMVRDERSILVETYRQMDDAGL